MKSKRMKLNLKNRWYYIQQYGLLAVFCFSFCLSVTAEEKLPLSRCTAEEFVFSLPFNISLKEASNRHEVFRKEIDENLMKTFSQKKGLKTWEEVNERINIIHVLSAGYTSPESSREGQDSLLARNISPKNLATAEKRGKVIGDWVVEVISNRLAQVVPLSILGDEKQLTQKDWEQLHFLATGAKVTSDFDIRQIFGMIDMFRSKKRLPNPAEKTLSEILGAKNTVELTVCYEMKPVAAAPIASVPEEKRNDQTVKAEEKGIDIVLLDGFKDYRSIIWSVLLVIVFFCALYAMFRWFAAYINSRQSLEDRFSSSDQAIRPSIRSSNLNTIAILSGKGGTGKSSIAVSLTHFLAHCGFKTLIVDMDLFTHGISIFSLADKGIESKQSLIDYFRTENAVDDIKPVLIPDGYTRDNLYLLPSLPGSSTELPDLNLAARFNDVQQFSNRFREILAKVKEKYSFDFVIIDTRGGIDFTSIGSALVAGSYIVVTETGKTSWEMGDKLLHAIRETKAKVSSESKCLGFVINKNSLPSKEIEKFLQKKWDIPFLETIPFDDQVVQFFEQTKVAVSTNAGCPFSRKILNIIETSIHTSGWNDYNNAHLQTTRKISNWFQVMKLLGVKSS